MKKKTSTTRRDFIKTTSAGIAAFAVPTIWTGSHLRSEDKNDQISVAVIGCGGRGSGIGRQAGTLGNILACCDVDSKRSGDFSSKHAGGCKTYVDYRRILDRKDVDVVTIGTPDHWHTKIAIDAMKAGKDLYCEKPLTLTIDEGKLIGKAVNETGRVFQVGTQQRSEYGQKFLQAIAITQSGRLGKKLKATSGVGGARSGGPFKEEAPPAHLNWEMWLGQAPMTPYIKERTHFQFRWWFEYSGGQVTDWGVHHTDIACWALGVDKTGPSTIKGSGVFNKEKNCYNVAHTFDCTLDYANGNQIVIDSGPNDLTIEGEKGRIQVNRSRLIGAPVDAINSSKKEQEWLAEEVNKLYRGMRISEKIPHMQNFFDCVRSRKLPISDVFTHHRSVSACHLANIAMLTDRKLTWDPEKEDFVGDVQASSMVKRDQRAPYQIT